MLKKVASSVQDLFPLTLKSCEQQMLRKRSEYTYVILCQSFYLFVLGTLNTFDSFAQIFFCF